MRSNCIELHLVHFRGIRPAGNFQTDSLDESLNTLIYYRTEYYNISTINIIYTS